MCVVHIYIYIFLVYMKDILWIFISLLNFSRFQYFNRDLYQLPPVCQPALFDMVSDVYARLHKGGSLWRDEFTMLELDEIMRQRDDKTFAELLCRVRMADCTYQIVQVDIQVVVDRGLY